MEMKMENEMETQGPFKGYIGILPLNNGESNGKEHGKLNGNWYIPTYTTTPCFFLEVRFFNLILGTMNLPKMMHASGEPSPSEVAEVDGWLSKSWSLFGYPKY